MKEIWKPINLELPKDLEGVYEVSNLGGVRRVHDGKILKQNKDSDGYLVCKLSKNKTKKTAKVHRLVASSFCPGRTKSSNVVNHKDFKKDNNCSSNLEWVTIKENNIHTAKRIRRFSEEQVKEMYRMRFSGYLLKDIGEVFETTPTNIKNILKGYAYADIRSKLTVI
jgi:hypothetical protein